MKSFVLLFALTMFASPVHAQVSGKTPQRRPVEPAPANVQHPGSTEALAGKVFLGERAPDFNLDGSQGREVKLSSLRGDWIVLAFGDRASDVLHLVDIASPLRPLGARVVGVCRE